MAEKKSAAAQKRARKRMQTVIADLQKYIVTYSDRPSYLDVDDSVVIDDMLYGLGIALSPGDYSFAQGYDAFKLRLLEHLNGG